MIRPKEVQAGRYVATISEEKMTSWGLHTRWTIRRDDVDVGSMFQGSAGYGERVTCSMTALVWSGLFPEDCADPKSPNYGICFDTGPHHTREEALADFAKRAERLIAWRAGK